MTDLQRLLEELNDQGFHGTVAGAVRTLLARAIAEWKDRVREAENTIFDCQRQIADQARNYQALKADFKRCKLNLDNANAEISRLQAARANECFSAPMEDESSKLRVKDETISELCERIEELEARLLAEDAALEENLKVYQLLDKLRKTEERESQRVKAQLEKLLAKDLAIEDLKDRLETAVNERNSALIHSRGLQTKLQIRDKEIARLNERIIDHTETRKAIHANVKEFASTLLKGIERDSK